MNDTDRPVDRFLDPAPQPDEHADMREVLRLLLEWDARQGRRIPRREDYATQHEYELAVIGLARRAQFEGYRPAVNDPEDTQ